MRESDFSAIETKGECWEKSGSKPLRSPFFDALASPLRLKAPRVQPAIYIHGE